MLTPFLAGRLFLQLAVAAMCAAAGFCPARVISAEPETLETVLAVWRKREAAAKSLKVVMSEDSRTEEAIGLEGALVGGTAKMQRVVILDGTNMRTERVGDTYQSVSKDPDHVTMYEVIDGRRSKSLTKVSRDDGATRSNGWINDRDKHTEAQNFHLSPVVRHWRPLSPA